MLTLLFTIHIKCPSITVFKVWSLRTGNPRNLNKRIVCQVFTCGRGLRFQLAVIKRVKLYASRIQTSHLGTVNDPEAFLLVLPEYHAPWTRGRTRDISAYQLPHTLLVFWIPSDHVPASFGALTTFYRPT